jgi:hypothetical protein
VGYLEDILANSDPPPPPPAAALTPFGRIRVMVMQNGYAPLPANGKRVLLPEWSKKHSTTLAEISLWDRERRRDTNTGVLTRDVPTLDFDISDEAAVAVALPIIARYVNGAPFLRRVGNPPKFAVPFRTDIPFNKIQVKFQSASGNSSKKEQKIEFLANGQQFIVDGRHPNINRDYQWFGGSPLTVPRAELPPIDAVTAAALVGELTAMLVERGYTVIEVGKATG